MNILKAYMLYNLIIQCTILFNPNIHSADHISLVQAEMLLMAKAVILFLFFFFWRHYKSYTTQKDQTHLEKKGAST